MRRTTKLKKEASRTKLIMISTLPNVRHYLQEEETNDESSESSEYESS